MQRRQKISAAIVAVEDDPHQMELLTMAIRGLPIDIPIVAAVDGADALSKLQNIPASEFAKTVALVLLDLRLPKMHGLEVLALLKQRGLTDKTPFIAFTSSDSTAERERSLSLGARDYLVKPLGYRAMQGLVSNLYERWIANRLNKH